MANLNAHEHRTDGELTSSKLIWKCLHFTSVTIFPQCGFDVAVIFSEHEVGCRSIEGLGPCLGMRVAQRCIESGSLEAE